MYADEGAEQSEVVPLQATKAGERVEVNSTHHKPRH